MKKKPEKKLYTKADASLMIKHAVGDGREHEAEERAEELGDILFAHHVLLDAAREHGKEETAEILAAHEVIAMATSRALDTLGRRVGYWRTIAGNLRRGRDSDREGAYFDGLLDAHLTNHVAFRAQDKARAYVAQAVLDLLDVRDVPKEQTADFLRGLVVAFVHEHPEHARRQGRKFSR